VPAQHKAENILLTSLARQVLQDIHPEDTYWCFADIGWITRALLHRHGPLALGATSVMYEGVPTYPDAGRPWRDCRATRSDNIPHRSYYDRMTYQACPDERSNTLTISKHMKPWGEPIERSLALVYNVVGKVKRSSVDTCWANRDGGFLCSTCLP